MAHFTGPDVTSNVNTMPSNLRGNYYVASYTLTESASASTTIALAALPAGARVTQLDLTIDNANLFDTATAAALQSVQLWAGGVGQTSGGTGKTVTYIRSAQAGTQINVWNPNEVALGYRLSSSSQVVFVLDNAPVGSGTTTTIFTVAIQYDTQKDGD
jgi:hypothetical protein